MPILYSLEKMDKFDCEDKVLMDHSLQGWDVMNKDEVT